MVYGNSDGGGGGRVQGGTLEVGLEGRSECCRDTTGVN